MARKKRSSSSVSIVQVVAMVVLVLVALIGLAFMLAPRKPMAPPSSRITYEPRPEERTRRYDPYLETAAIETGEEEALPALDESELEDTEVVSLPEAPETVFVVKGRVVSAENSQPVRNAQVVVTRKHTSEDNIMLAALDESVRQGERVRMTRAHTGRSDDAGAFAVDLSYAGVYEVVVTAPGYVRYAEETPRLDEDRKETSIEARLSRGATISGRVVEAGTDVGAAGLTVRVESPQGPFGVTDADGSYEIRGLSEGQFGVAVDLRGSPYMAGRNLPYQRVTISGPDERLRNIDFTVDAAGIVWGYVLSPNEDPISQANVTLSSGESIIAQALSTISQKRSPVADTSGTDGYYELTGVPLNEEWRIHAHSGTYAPQLSDPFILTGSNRDVRIDIYMFAGTNVYGQVVGGDGNPIPGAEVMCLPSYGRFFSAMTAPQAFRGATSDQNGRFTLLELPGGDYQIFAQKQGYKISPVGFPIYPDGYSDIRNVQIVLRGVDEGQHSVFGVVVNDRGQGIDGAQVRMAGISMGGLEGTDQSTTTANNGAFRFDGVSAGQYTVIATKDGYSPTTARRIRLNEEMRMVLRQSARVRGRVLIAATRQAPELYDVAAYPLSESTGSISLLGMMSDSAQKETFFAPDGSFDLILNAGAYRLEGSAVGYTPARTEIVVDAGDVIEGVDLSLEEKGGSIAGVVVAGDNGSVQGATVTLLEASSPAEALMMLAADAASSDRIRRLGDDGVFEFENLPAGEYIIIAQHPTYPNAQSEMIFLAEGAREENVRIRFGTGGALEGYVYQDGRPQAGAVVVVVGNGITEHTNTDNTGYYYLDSLADGVYQAMVTDLSAGDLSSVYGARGVQVTVQEGQITRYDFGTRDGARIEARCIPGPMNMLGGRAVLQAPGYFQAPLGETVEVTQLLGQSVGINPRGDFVMEDVPPGEWQLDIYYFELGVANPLDVRYVHTELIEATDGEVLTLNLPISY